jgi:AcrR family transcriptional regulator
MPVNGDKSHSAAGAGRRTQAERREATRAALLRAARDLFAEKGYAGAGREEIVARAGVTRGAMYHHFANKHDLFRAVVEELEQEVMGKVAEAGMEAMGDPRQSLRRGCGAFLDIAAADESVRRILLLDAPSVLGWSEWRDLEARYALGLVKEVLVHAMEMGQIREQPVDPLAHMLLAALNEAALLVAQADDPARTRSEVGEAVDRLVDVL